MKISTKGRYALRMMLDIAVHQGEGYVALKEIAARQNISKKYLEQIALQLTQSGLLHAVRGHQGGYRLMRAPEEYTVDQILAVTEGSLAPVTCLDCKPNTCTRTAECRTLPLWEKLYALIENYLDGVTLADLSDTSRIGDYQI